MLDQVISLGWGVLSLSREKAQEFVEEMVKKSELGKENSKIILRTLIERGANERSAFKKDLNTIISKLLQKGIFATRSELATLTERVNQIEESLKNNSELPGES